MARKDSIVDDDDILTQVDEEDDAASRDTEVDETSVLDADDMYGLEQPKPARGKSNKGSGVKAASKSAKDDEWRPANTLDAPPPRPGMIQRWIRYQSPGPEGNLDAKNWSRATREGWSPRKLGTVPEGFDAPTAAHAQYGTVISIGDLILCEMPIERYKARRKFFREKLARQLAAITKKPLTMAESLNGPHIQVESKKDVSFGRRKARATDED